MTSGQLPVGYTPFCISTARTGDVYTHRFQVKESSHLKTVSALLGSVGSTMTPAQTYGSLLPSELWAMARVLSSAYGRMNELALVRTVWHVYGTVESSTPLRARTTIGRIRVGRLPRCTTHSETTDADGRLLLQAADDVLMTHDCKKPFYEERPTPSARIPRELRYRHSHKVYFRYQWDPSLWFNNLHTDRYAQLCGFKKGVPEFPVYMDWIYHVACQTGWFKGGRFSIRIRRILPMYADDVVEVIAYEQDGNLTARFIKDGVDRLVAKLSNRAT